MRPRGHRALVLVVDDEEPMLEVFTEILERLNVSAVARSDPRDAAASVEKGDRYDLVLLDLRMPHIDGLALLERIRATQPDVPVIVITGYPCAETARRSRALGALYYVRKPFDPEELARRVREALGPRQPG